MPTPTRPYIVVNNANGDRKLIVASSQAQARNFAARTLFSVDVASANDVIDLIRAGVEPITASADETEPMPKDAA